MARRGCAHCGSAEVQAEFNKYMCLECGGYTDDNGNALPRRPRFEVPSKPFGETQHG